MLVDGADAAGRRVAHLAATVGLAFQDPDRQIFAGKVRGEVAFGPRNLGRSGAELEAAIDAALVATGLDKDAQTNPYDLGFSRRKLLALASILAMGTPVVVLDEPTTGQDARGVDRVHRIVADLSAAGRTVIAISHDMRFVAEAFERVIVMRDGRVVLDGTPAEVFAETAWPVARLDVPRAATGRADRGAARAGLDPDRRRAPGRARRWGRLRAARRCCRPAPRRGAARGPNSVAGRCCRPISGIRAAHSR